MDKIQTTMLDIVQDVVRDAPPATNTKKEPCKDCPHPVSAVFPTVDTIYLGGPRHAQYLVIRQMIPPHDPSVITKYGWPTGQDDGSFVYTEGEELPAMEGFEVAGRVVRPLWPFCPSRSLRAALQDTGLLQIEARCMNSLAGQPPWQPIRLTACQNCSFKPAEKLRRTGPIRGTARPPGVAIRLHRTGGDAGTPSKGQL